MCNAIEGRGERGILACVFEEFTLQCKETWSRIIDGTCLLIMNLSSCYRLTLGKYYSKLSFPNHCFFFFFSASTSEMSATESVGVCGLAFRHLGFAMISGPWARV